MRLACLEPGLVYVYAYRKRAKVREPCVYCSKTSHASEDCPVKLAAEEGDGSDDAEISNSDGEGAEAEPRQSSQPETLRHQSAATQRQSGSNTSCSPEVQAKLQLARAKSQTALRASVLSLLCPLQESCTTHTCLSHTPQHAVAWSICVSKTPAWCCL